MTVFLPWGEVCAMSRRTTRPACGASAGARSPARRAHVIVGPVGKVQIVHFQPQYNHAEGAPVLLELLVSAYVTQALRALCAGQWSP